MGLRFVRYTLLAGAPFGLMMGAIFAAALFAAGSDARIGIWLGVASGLLFGLILAAFAETQRRRMESRSGLFEGEAIVLQGPGNHFLRGEGRGGWLTLTPTRLAFRSHGKNLQNAPVDIQLSEVASAAAYRTAGLIPNGLKVARKDGTSERFVVSARRDWVRTISNALTKVRRS
jgi:hypothetical protein